MFLCHKAGLVGSSRTWRSSVQSVKLITRLAPNASLACLLRHPHRDWLCDKGSPFLPKLMNFDLWPFDTQKFMSNQLRDLMRKRRLHDLLHCVSIMLSGVGRPSTSECSQNELMIHTFQFLHNNCKSIILYCFVALLKEIQQKELNRTHFEGKRFFLCDPDWWS